MRQQVGPVKKVGLYYNDKLKSTGSASVVFHNQESAMKALTTLNGIKVDGRPIEVEMMVNAANAPAPPAPKSLNDRISKPKTQKEKPKPATGAKEGTEKKGGRGRGRGRAPRGGRNGTNTRQKPKTADELDQDMTDYWNTGTANGDAAMATNGGAVQSTGANGDTGMDDEIMVSAF